MGVGVGASGSFYHDLLVLRGQNICINCDINQAQKIKPHHLHLLALRYQKIQAVMEVEWVSYGPALDATLIHPSSLYLRGSPVLIIPLFLERTANTVYSIAGVLRSTHTFDVASVTFSPEPLVAAPSQQAFLDKDIATKFSATKEWDLDSF